jgi:hypothetical protein
VPAHHRLWLKNHQRSLPPKPNRSEENPEQPIRISELGLLGVSTQHRELMTLPKFSSSR